MINKTTEEIETIFLDYNEYIKEVDESEINLKGCLKPKEACERINKLVEWSVCGAVWAIGLLIDVEGHLYTIENHEGTKRYSMGYIRELAV